MRFTGNKYIQALKYHKLLLFLSHVIARLGFEIKPFYLTQEFPGSVSPMAQPSGLESVVYVCLSLPELEKLLAATEYKNVAAEQEKLTGEDCLYYALVKDGQIMSLTACNLKRCHSDLSPFPLEPDEAYLFGARTLNKYRGMNLAPYLRYKVYQSLAELGRHRLYSLTEYFNKPALTFKKKMNARHLKLQVLVQIFHIFRVTLTLKKYTLTNSRQ
jgi:hypothetical protein